MSEAAELTDEQITAYLADPATIPTHDVARQVMDCLDAELSDIQAQVDAATIESNACPLSEERQEWLRRACYAGAIRKRLFHRVIMRDKEIRGTKGSSLQEPKYSKEEKALKQQRLLVEAERQRDAKKLQLLNAKLREMELSQQKRDPWNKAIDICAAIVEGLKDWGPNPNREQVSHIAQTIRGQRKRDNVVDFGEIKRDIERLTQKLTA